MAPKNLSDNRPTFEERQLTGPGLLIAAARSGAGKTTLTLGLMRALTRRGLKVGAAKCGPDYIDSAFHQAATGRESLNLDSWAMPPALVLRLAGHVGAKTDIVIVEGAMGLFDGAAGAEPARGAGASADIAAATGWPIVLVLDVSGQAQTAAAIVKGLATYDSRISLAGVVLNKIGSDRHRLLCAQAISSLGVPVLGALPREAEPPLPERHLGLVQAQETAGLEALLDRLADRVEKHVDLDALCACARGGLSAPESTPAGLKPPGQRIAVARDEAFSFFYPHVALAWREAGAELKFFSPLADEPPRGDCDICWLPGGYPELHAGRLAAADRFRGGLRRFAQDRPVHGECGGYMALGRTLVDAAGEVHVMAGLLELDTSFLQRKLHLGYRRARLAADHPLAPAGSTLFGHEFHYATALREEGDRFAFARDAYGDAEQPCGLRRGLVSGSFFHAMA
ncbi:MAG TPA: cobyrinate a,c-diamide synthase [Methylocystis sp.]|nr:cobyrinate a,c-diamide synthase [Methylocystis sp.]